MEIACSTHGVDCKYIKYLFGKLLEGIRIIGHKRRHGGIICNNCRHDGIIGRKRRHDIICHKCRHAGIGQA